MKQSNFTEQERYLFGEGTYYRCYDRFGAHAATENGQAGYRFAIWAPGVHQVWVTGSFNQWQARQFPLSLQGTGGIWEGFVPTVQRGDLYKYVLETAGGEVLYKTDPFAFATQCPPETAGKVCTLDYDGWQDVAWLRKRRRTDHRKRPLNIYEVHAESWRRHPQPPAGDGECLTWGELAQTLPDYAAEMGYTHVELLPIMEHPFSGSWGYQITGYYAPTARHGTPQAFMAFVNACHRRGLGVILDWAPAHFCRDAHGLGQFNGEKLYEGRDNEQWGTYRFDYRRNQVRSFLISNLLFWLEVYHVDGIRVDGVSSMLYLNFGVEDPGKKRVNAQGGEEDLDAVAFLRQMNRAVGERFPGVFLIAEESSPWPMVTMPPEKGGLGFHYKWDMGWMNDTLRYLQTDFPYRSGCHTLLTFSMMYQFSENFILPLSHDEVVHGKCSLIGRMPGDYWRQFANLRLLALYQMTHPGGKLNFMGNEIGQFIEWRYDASIEWFLTEYEAHRKHQAFIRALNHRFLKERALWQRDHGWDGFQWLDANNRDQSILLFLRRGDTEQLVVLLNFQPQVYTGYRVGVPEQGRYFEVFNSDSLDYGGSGKCNHGFLKTEDIPWHGMAQSVTLQVPPVGGLMLKRFGAPERASRQEKRTDHV